MKAAVAEILANNERRYSTAELRDATGATSRQLQWWDEYGILTPAFGIRGHSRAYSAEQVETARRIMQLRRAGVSLQAVQKFVADRSWSIVLTTREPAVAIDGKLVVFSGRGTKFKVGKRKAGRRW